MSMKRQAGELLIDHSNSPGIPAELAAEWEAQGIPVARSGVRVEHETYTCRHCETIVVMNPQRTRERNVCRKCMAVVCDKPSCVLECQPFDKIIERVVSGKSINLDPGTGLLLPERRR